jgi:hypothetical protein
MREGGITFMIFPGGHNADEYDWRTSTNTQTGQQTFVDPLEYVGVRDAIGGDVMYTANYGSGTPQDARDLVQYLNVTHNKNVLYFSIGNECYHPDEYDIRPQPLDHDAETYAQFFIQAYQMMKAVDPRVKIGFTGTMSENDWPQRTTVINPRTGAPANGWGAVVLSRLREAGITPDYMDFHIYTITPQKETDANALQMSERVEFILGLCRTTLSDYLGSNAANVKINLTESNSAWMPAGRQSVSLTNALYLANFWGQVMKNGMETFVWWNLHNGANFDGNTHPMLYGSRNFGDFGILSRGVPEGTAPPLNTRYPTFFAFKMLKNFARDGDTFFLANSANPHLRAFAVRTPAGRVRVMLLNMAKDREFLTTFSGFVIPASATVHTYGMAQESNDLDVSTTTVSLTGPSLLSSARSAIRLPKYSINVVEF